MHYEKQMEKIALPSGPTQKIPTPHRAKIKMQKPQSVGKFLVQTPGVRGGMVMAKIDSCIKYYI